MEKLNYIIDFKYIIFPKFYTATDAEHNEYVFLQTGEDKIKSLNFVDELDCDFSDHVIVRFHQHWENEAPFYDIDCFPNIREYKIGL